MICDDGRRRAAARWVVHVIRSESSDTEMTAKICISFFSLMKFQDDRYLQQFSQH